MALLLQQTPDLLRNVRDVGEVTQLAIEQEPETVIGLRWRREKLSVVDGKRKDPNTEDVDRFVLVENAPFEGL